MPSGIESREPKSSTTINACRYAPHDEQLYKDVEGLIELLCHTLAAYAKHQAQAHEGEISGSDVGDVVTGLHAVNGDVSSG